jgi:ADP-ribose pyrophosphatase YjhB (NUDIX family)
MNTQQKIPFPPQITLCVGAVVLRENKVLFVRQAYGGLKGKWSLPWGFVEGKKPDGSIEPPEMAATRETCEEARVIAKVDGLLAVQNHSTSEMEPRLYLVFLCHHVAGEPEPDNHETDGAAYFSLEEMANFHEPFDEFCEWMAKHVLEGRYHVLQPQPANPYSPHLAFL